MSKKKFKKKFRAEIHQQIQEISQEPKDNKVINAVSASTFPEKPEKQLLDVSPASSEAVKKTNVDTKVENFSYVKHDIKKIGIIFSLVLALLIIIYLISIKTSWSINVSDWIASVLHIS